MTRKIYDKFYNSLIRLSFGLILLFLGKTLFFNSLVDITEKAVTLKFMYILLIIISLVSGIALIISAFFVFFENSLKKYKKKKLNSTLIRSIEYHFFKRHLYIHFHYEGLHRFHKVPFYKYIRLKLAVSPGRFYHKHIKMLYKSELIKRNYIKPD